MTLQDNRLSSRGSVLRGAFLATVCLLAVGAALLLGAENVGAHGNPEVNIEPNPAAFGGEVTIAGEGFEDESEVSLALEGALGEISLGTATTDSEGVFRFTATLPSTAAPGGYRFRAVGADDVAVADVRIQEGEGGGAPAAEHAAGVGFHGLDSGVEVAGLAALAGGMVAVALLILWFPWKERHA